MRVLLQYGRLILVPETGAEQVALAEWKTQQSGHVLYAQETSRIGQTFLAAREALLATGERPLTHRVRRDSKTIPGIVMADIWMRIRAGLREGSGP